MKVTKQAQYLRKDGHLGKKILYKIKEVPDVMERGKFGDEYRITLEDGNGTEFCFPAWQQHMNVLIDAFGDETKGWVGQSVAIWTEEITNREGKKVAAWHLSNEISGAITEGVNNQ